MAISNPEENPYSANPSFIRAAMAVRNAEETYHNTGHANVVGAIMAISCSKEASLPSSSVCASTNNNIGKAAHLRYAKGIPNAHAPFQCNWQPSQL